MSGLMMEGGFEPFYDIPEEEVLEMTRDVIAHSTAAEGTFIGVNFQAENPNSNLARNLEREVFEAKFGNNAEEMAEEYGPYESASHFIMVVDTQSEKPAGVVRLIRDSEAGLKSVNDLEEPLGITPEDFKDRQGLVDLKTCLDFGTLAVAPAFRGRLSGYDVSTMLYRGVFAIGEREATEHIVTVIDEKARKGVDILGVPLVEVEGTGAFPYLGSDASYAMYGDFSQFRDKVTAKYEQHKEDARLSVDNVLHPRMFVQRRMTARIAGKLVTGKGLDEYLDLSDPF